MTSLRQPSRTSDVPSLGKRMFRTSARFLIAVLIGVGATLAWQSYRGEAREMVRAWAPSLSWLLPVSTTETVAATATLVQELKPISLDLALVRHTLQQLATNQDQLAAKQDQLAARQEQMAQNIATLQEIEQGVRQKIYPYLRPGGKRRAQTSAGACAACYRATQAMRCGHAGSVRNVRRPIIDSLTHYRQRRRLHADQRSLN